MNDIPNFSIQTLEGSIPAEAAALSQASYPIWTTSPIPERATLTLLRDGTFVLGCPRDAWDEQRHKAIDGIKKYLSGEHGGLVFPWPCDVDDQRTKVDR